MNAKSMNLLWQRECVSARWKFFSNKQMSSRFTLVHFTSIFIHVAFLNITRENHGNFPHIWHRHVDDVWAQPTERWNWKNRRWKSFERQSINKLNTVNSTAPFIAQSRYSDIWIHIWKRIGKIEKFESNDKHQFISKKSINAKICVRQSTFYSDLLMNSLLNFN